MTTLLRDSTKVVIGFGCIWGLYCLGATLLGALTLSANGTPTEIAAFATYGFTFLPSSILAIWYPRAAGTWLIALAAISTIGIASQASQGPNHGSLPDLLGQITWMAAIIIIPALLGHHLRSPQP